MIHKKVCMLGGFAVGKTSMVRRWVSSIFSEKYLTTVGVKIDKKTVVLDGQEMVLMLWDLAGEDQFNRIQGTYLRGASGYLLVADGTRRTTLEKAFEIKERVEREIGSLPFVLVLNKYDLKAEWEIGEDDLALLERLDWVTFNTSARTGEAIEDAFSGLAAMMR